MLTSVPCLAEILFNLKTETDLCHNRKTIEGIGENHGFSACRKHFTGGHTPLLVLLRSRKAVGIDIGVVDRVLVNFDRTARLFHHILYTKLFALVLLALSCLGTKGVKEEKSRGQGFGRCLQQGWCCFF